MAYPKVGGSFAPPLTEATLNKYKELAASCEDKQTTGYLEELLKMVEVFNETPESSRPGTPHVSGAPIVVVPLEEEEVQRIWDFVPWMEECDLMGKVFDKLEGDLRNAAYHLLWFARELTLDREPLTSDKLQ